jgi:hypothetical protein
MRGVEMIARIAEQLGELRLEVVFLGGAVTGLLLSDPAAPEVRATEDVDLIFEAATWLEHVRLSERLRQLGFVEDASEGAPICRWIAAGIKVDVMPTGVPSIGCDNPWYAPSMAQAALTRLGDLEVRVISAAFFLATKLTAFEGRGRGDYRASRDIEDLVAVVDGRPELSEEVRQSPADLQAFLADRLGRMLADPLFLEALPGHLPGDEASQARLPLLMARLRALAKAG